MTWPIAARAATGLADLWDAKLVAWILHWDFHQTFHDPIHLFDANIFFPARYALAFSENLYGSALFGFPLYALGVPTLTVYNVLFLLGVFLSALAAWALAREVTGDPAASLLAGLVYAFVPWRMAQIPHFQFQWGAFLALLLLFLLRYLAGGRRKDLVWFGVFLAWNALTNAHYALYSAFLVVLVAGFQLLRQGTAALPPVSKAFLVAAAAAVAVLPFYLPYARANRMYGMRRYAGEAAAFSGRPADFLSAGVKNKFWGPVTRRWSRAEGDFFPGVAPLVLAALALARAGTGRSLRRDRPPQPLHPPLPPPRLPRPRLPSRVYARRFLDVAILVLLAAWIAARAHPQLVIGAVKLRDPTRVLLFLLGTVALRLIVAFPRALREASLGDFVRRLREPLAALFALIALLGVVLALGMNTPVYRFLFESAAVPFRSLRVPARAIVLFHVGLAVLAAWGLSRVTRSMPATRRALFVSAFLLVTCLEYRIVPTHVWPVDANPPAVYRWLAGTDLPGGVLEWPTGSGFDPEYEFRSTAHWKPLVNGASGFRPQAHAELFALLSGTEVPGEFWERLAGFRASLLVLHAHGDPDPLVAHFRRAAQSGVESGRLEPIRRFPHGSGSDYVFRVAGSPAFSVPTSLAQQREAREAWALAVKPAAASRGQVPAE